MDPGGDRCVYIVNSHLPDLLHARRAGSWCRPGVHMTAVEGTRTHGATWWGVHLRAHGGCGINWHSPLLRPPSCGRSAEDTAFTLHVPYAGRWHILGTIKVKAVWRERRAQYVPRGIDADKMTQETLGRERESRTTVEFHDAPWKKWHAAHHLLAKRTKTKTGNKVVPRLAKRRFRCVEGRKKGGGEGFVYSQQMWPLLFLHYLRRLDQSITFTWRRGWGRVHRSGR